MMKVGQKPQIVIKNFYNMCEFSEEKILVPQDTASESLPVEVGSDANKVLFLNWLLIDQ